MARPCPDPYYVLLLPCRPAWRGHVSLGKQSYQRPKPRSLGRRSIIASSPHCVFPTAPKTIHAIYEYDPLRDLENFLHVLIVVWIMPKQLAHAARNETFSILVQVLWFYPGADRLLFWLLLRSTASFHFLAVVYLITADRKPAYQEGPALIKESGLKKTHCLLMRLNAHRSNEDPFRAHHWCYQEKNEPVSTAGFITKARRIQS